MLFPYSSVFSTRFSTTNFLLPPVRSTSTEHLKIVIFASSPCTVCIHSTMERRIHSDEALLVCVSQSVCRTEATGSKRIM